VDQIEEIVDPESRIITFTFAERMAEAAKKWIAPKYNGGILGLKDSDRTLMDTARSIRNYIAHGSDSSYTEMNDYLEKVDKWIANRGLGRSHNKVDNVGSFLKVQLNREKRVEKYLNRLKSIGAQM
jgi:hypothetical protein